MECKTCEQKQRHFFCESCLKKHLRDFHVRTSRFAAGRDDHVAKASAALEGMNTSRTARATMATYQESIDDIMGGLARLRKDNEKKRDRLRTLRESLAARRYTLSRAKLLGLSGSSSLQDPTITKVSHNLATLTATVSRARSGLIQELVEVFHVVEVGGRPPVGGKAGSKGEWTIGGLILPVPGDMRRYPPDHINTVLTHTIHFLSLLTFYLGIKMPFEIIWGPSGSISGSSPSKRATDGGKSAKKVVASGKLGVGVPWIGAARGGETGGWASWTTKQPLHLSTSYVPYTHPKTKAEGASERMLESFLDEPSVGSSPSSNVEHSHSPSSSSSFTVALSMLIYDVCYLAYTQGVEVPLSQAGDVLCNLWAVCCSTELGKRSHATTPYLPLPTPPSFPLDFAQLLQATAAGPVRSKRGVGNGMGHRMLKTAVSGMGVGRTTVRPDKFVEDGWDLVDEESFD